MLQSFEVLKFNTLMSYCCRLFLYIFWSNEYFFRFRVSLDEDYGSFVRTLWRTIQLGHKTEDDGQKRTRSGKNAYWYDALLFSVP